jgi:RHS repeat-associated protein
MDTLNFNTLNFNHLYKIPCYGFNGMEKDDEWSGCGKSYDFGARIYDSRLGRWMSVDPLFSKYPGFTPYSYVNNMPIWAIDPDGRRIIFVNGKVGGGSPEAGASYWGGANDPFVKGAQKHYYDNQEPYFTNQDYGYLSTPETRREDGKKYAEDNFEDITLGLSKDKDVIRIVTHSMGGAFGIGIKDYLESQGYIVEEVVLINTKDASGIELSENDKATIIDFQTTNDPVIGATDWNENKDIKNADFRIKVESKNENILTIHRDPIDESKQNYIDGVGFWQTLTNQVWSAELIPNKQSGRSIINGSGKTAVYEE